MFSKLTKTIFLSTLAIVFTGKVGARVFMTQDEALRLAFPEEIQVERKSLFLSDAEMDKVKELAKAPIDSALLTYYVGSSTSASTGYAFFDSHLVRSMPETLMVVLNSDGRVRFVEILSFYEPPDYLPIAKWLDLFKEKELNDDLWLRRSIRNVTGATLTTQSITDSVRRILAIYNVAIKGEAP